MQVGVGDEIFLVCKKPQTYAENNFKRKTKAFYTKKMQYSYFTRYTLGTTWLFQETVFGFH